MAYVAHLATQAAPTLPLKGAVTCSSIFIDSSTTTVCPVTTASPACAFTAHDATHHGREQLPAGRGGIAAPPVGRGREHRRASAHELDLLRITNRYLERVLLAQPKIAARGVWRWVASISSPMRSR